MNPAKAETWRRFYERVLSDKSWPRDLWFAAVEDALRAALPEGSRLVEDFRTDVAELTRLERARSGSWHDEQRIGQLEQQIGRLIDIADETIKQSEGVPEWQPGSPPRARWGFGRTLATLGIITLLIGAGWSGATYYYELRLARQVERQLQPYVDDLRQTLGKVQADLAARKEVTSRLSRRLNALHAELSAKTQTFDTLLADTRKDLAALHEEVVADLEQRLRSESGAVAQTLGSLRQRASALGHGFDEVGKTLATLRERAPDLGQGISDLAEQLAATEAAFERTANQMARLEDRVARPAGWTAGEAGAEERAGEPRPAPLGELTAQIVQLKGEVDQSRGSIARLNSLLDQSLERAKLDGMVLQTAVREARGAERQLDQLMSQVQAEVESTHQAMQGRIEQMLGDLATRADQALEQSQTALREVEAEAGRKVEQASRNATVAIEGSREEQAASLVAQAAAMRAELDRARGALLARWENVDRKVTQRQDELLSDLDRYGEVLEARLQEFLDAVDMIVAQAESQAPAGDRPSQ